MIKTSIIGLSGYARAGKDTVASILREDGWTRIAFADKLKEAVYQLDPLIEYDITLQELWDSDLDAAQNWEDLKQQYAEVRRMLQRMGTEVGRNLFGENFWVNQGMASIKEDGKYVFTDCRFPSEAQAVRGHGGVLWRIERPGYGPVNNHPSETSLDHHKFDQVIINDTTIDDLRAKVLALVKRESVTI